MSARTAFSSGAAAVALAAATAAGAGAALAAGGPVPGPGSPAASRPVARLAAKLTPAVTAPSEEKVLGKFSGTVAQLPQGAMLAWRLSVTGARGRVSAQVRLGGQFGPPILVLCSPCSKALRRSSFVPPQLVDALLHGGATITIATRQQPLGVARGQIEVLR